MGLIDAVETIVFVILVFMRSKIIGIKWKNLLIDIYLFVCL
jgi:hypothetical protein